MLADSILTAAIKNCSIMRSTNLLLGPADNFTSKAAVLVQSIGALNESAINLEMNRLAIERASALFNCKFANISANFGEVVYRGVLCALLRFGDLIMDFDFGRDKRSINKSIFGLPDPWFEFVSYKINQNTNSIDMNELSKFVSLCHPKLIFIDVNTCPMKLNWRKLRKVADAVGACLMADISTISGLIASGTLSSPIQYCHVVVTTTHESLKGPLGSLVMSNDPRIAAQLSSVPILQRSAVAAAQAVAFHEASTLEFKHWSTSVVRNAKALNVRLQQKGLSIINDGTVNHLVSIDLKPLQLTWDVVNKTLNSCYIAANRNYLSNDGSCFHFGTNALTSRGMTETQMADIADEIAEILFAMSFLRELSVQLEAKVRKFVLHLAFKFPVLYDCLPSPSDVAFMQPKLITNSPKAPQLPSVNVLTNPKGNVLRTPQSSH
ncbi:MAG: hypothetical protein ACTS45_01110 [Candidatus Hodgkinia cicadicola]